QVQPLSPFGDALLAQPALAAWRRGLGRGPGHCAVAALRAFLACFAPDPDVLLLGALPFEAWRLARPGEGNQALGQLFFSERLWRRDGAGQWSLARLSLPDHDPAADAVAAQAPPVVLDEASNLPGDDHPPGGYARMVERALERLRDGTLVSLTLSQSYRRAVTLAPSAAFRRLGAANPSPARFFFHDGAGLHLLGASPVLQLVVAGGEVQALPVCGTVARRPGAVGEAQSQRELLNEEVDAAALAVCSDALRNDLAPLCVPGSLQLADRRRLLSLATVVHAVDRLRGRLREGADAWDAIVATAAPVMATGTPRAPALAAIAQLEASPRGWYGGLMVQVASNGDALAGTILRAAAVRAGVAEVRTGGDLLADSDPAREEQESRLKTLSLWRAFGLDASGAPAAASAVANWPLPAAVRVDDTGDAFGAGLRDALLGLGLQLADGDDLCCVASCAGMPAASHSLVAIGDAALAVLQGAGFAVDASRPAHGRVLHCASTPAAPWRQPRSFLAAQYAKGSLLEGPTPVGWDLWAIDANGLPVALAHPQSRTVCLLFRPDSLLSDALALEMLRMALAFAGSSEPGPALPAGAG
ncbi:MAG TPA: chorismate-binding protein, partial [Ramlibacter sp.]|nr:chorismate-binding protein [Ramlibacter sp.]